MAISPAKRPRCYILWATAPDGTTMRAANDCINDLVGDRSLPLAVFHDHFLDRAGGIVVFQIEDAGQARTLGEGISRHLSGWQVETRPLIFSHSASAFDEQIAYTLRTYRNEDWSQLRTISRPRYGDPSREAQTGIED